MATTWCYVRPCNDLESPFSVKHRHLHLPFLRQSKSSLVEHLYRLTTDQDNHTIESREKLWVLRSPPVERACLKLREIQESVTLENPLGVDCFNIAVRNLVAEDADKFQHTKCMGWRHIYRVCKMDSTRADEYSSPKLTSTRSVSDIFGPHLVFIPVVHDGDWSLYAFNMWDRRLSILDPSSLRYREMRHREIRGKISGVLNENLGNLSDGSHNDICTWECQFPMVPTQQNRNDSGYFVFNFMRLWDGHQLAQSFPEDSRDLRKDFLAYMMCFKENEAALPPLVATCISNLSEETKMARKHCRTWAMYPMDSRLLLAVNRGNVADFDNLLDAEANGTDAADGMTTNVATDKTDSHDAPANEARQNFMFLRRVARGIVDAMASIAARHGPENRAGGGGVTATREAPQPTESGEARGGGRETNGRVDVVVVQNSGETLQPTENGEAQQSPVNGEEAATWRVEVVPLSRLSSMLLGGVTSAGDGVLHIAARHCYLDLVIHICWRAGIRIRRPGENNAAAPPAPALSSHHNQDTLPFAEFLRARNHKGETCLHEAVRSACKDMVCLLMQVDAALNDEATPPLVQILDDNGASPLYVATTTSHDILKALTVRDYKYQVSHAGPAGKTALHAAVVACNNKDICEELLNWKSSLARKRDESGRTPLHYTSRWEATAITKLILQKDPSSGYIADSEGSLPIHIAASMGKLDVIKELLNKCQNCDSACDAAGRTFLHVAVEKGRANVVKYVCTDPKFRTILNTGDHNGDTALHMAVQKSSRTIFCLLYGNNEVSLNSINNQGRTPLDLAIISNTMKPKFKEQVYRAWLRNDLLADGAGFGPRERDDFPFRNCVLSDLDKDKESERLTKSAGLLAAVVSLILTVSLQAPFNIANKHHSGKIGSTNSEKKREKIFGEFINNDVNVLFLSTTAILCFTIAGFPYAGLSKRSILLNYGGICLWCTVLQFLISVTDELSLVYPKREVVVLGFFMVSVTVLCGSMLVLLMSEPCRIGAHVLARLHRLGFRRWLRSLIPFHREASWTPYADVLMLLFVCYILAMGVNLALSLTHDLKFVQSQKTVI